MTFLRETSDDDDEASALTHRNDMMKGGQDVFDEPIREQAIQ